MTNAVECLTLDEKLNLIKSRARILGFRRHDLEDAVQEVMLSVLEFKFDQEKSNGATEATALTTIIDRRLKLLKRASRRYAGLIERATGRLSIEYRGCQDGPFEEDHNGESRIVSDEVSAALAGLDDETLQIAQLLMEGMSTKAIAEQLGTSWHRADRLVSVIRERLEAAGLNPSISE